MSHLGRPEGSRTGALAPPGGRAADRSVGREVHSPRTASASRRIAVDSCDDGEIVLLENVRFHPEEEANDPEFARRLA